MIHDLPKISLSFDIFYYSTFFLLLSEEKNQNDKRGYHKKRSIIESNDGYLGMDAFRGSLRYPIVYNLNALDFESKRSGDISRDIC